MKLKIWHKMNIGITIPFLIAVLGGILAYAYINDVKYRQGFVRVADDLKEQVLEIRRNEKNFLHFKNELHLKRLNNAISSLNSSIDSISQEDIVKIGTDGFSLLHKSIQTYSHPIDTLHKSYQQENMVTDKVRSKGRKLEVFAAKGKHAKELSTSFVLHLRLLEKNYMIFRDKKSYLELNKGLSQLKNITPICYQCFPYIEAIRNLFAAYEKSDSMAKDLEANGDKLEEIAGRLSFHERQKISSFITLTQRLLLIGLVLLCTLGPLFVYKTASYIVAPIKRLSEIAKKISGGDISLRAPLKEHDETYSLAVSFNTMLDNLQHAQHSLQESFDLLNEKQAQLVESEKRASMGFLVAGVAHELNNPLNNISLRAEIVKEEIKKISNEKLNDYVQDIVMQSERAHKIINNLLDFARARKSADMEKQDIVGVINDSLNLVTNHLKVNNIKLNKEIPDRIFYVKGNRSKLEQIFISIINNAVQAMEYEGTLTVSFKPDDENKKILINISDTGKGIPETDLKNIFEPFFTTKPPGEGTGLGLAVSRTLVTEHKGKIDVKSKMGMGTAFTIILPLYEETE
jgi:signal transduction histidine kinase